ncbi:ABC-type multidrug transport system, ATPase component [Modestobacter italicus]|uniref:ABC-type multidrug transport system, ATPase component n=1 Tax=Modestobacter italicus (strain DSM 44449 / CECT 9708 / BC 501) TaxID=2732864 RepID=I4F3H6_MODI5|nr:ABC transporter ATP-binding protein [Modestobacter marinus]CCH90189.1 ABC-type multidrug transport system, ATPase component [Modestobacter marinus]
MSPVDPDAAISVRGLVKRYGDRNAVDGLDLDIARGEIFALLGPNGAGKTTTVEVLEGYRERDGGEVQVLGVDPARGGRRWKADIGIVLQSGAGDSQLTCLELLRAHAAYYPDPRDPAEVLELVGLTEKAGARGRTLSGGQRRRLDVALGIVGRPRLLFLDEPTTGFDPEARRQFWSLIRSLRDLGTTMLLTTHYLDEAEELADRVGVIARGRLVEVAVPSELGGRGQAPAVVHWTEGGVRRAAETATPTAFVAELAARFPGEVPDLAVARPTLEDVYLRMIGEPS